MEKLRGFLVWMVIAAGLLTLSACASHAVNTPTTVTAAANITTVGTAGTEGTSTGTAAKGAPIELTISAAASLKESMEDIQSAYSQVAPDITLTFNFGSSGSLQQQIEQGAAVDLYISAAAKQMDALAEKSLILDDTRCNLLKNQLVLVVPAGTSTINEIEDLSQDTVKQIALGETTSVPAGQYAQEVLTGLGLMDMLTPKIVYAKDVKEVLAWIETGNADAGFIYQSDARFSDQVAIVATAPEDSHKPIIYPAAIVKDSKNPEQAEALINYLQGDDAKEIFEAYGFTMVE